jgi:hypothetical protein
VLRGHLDNVTSLGYIEGWALDTEAPTRIVEVSVVAGGVEIAWGLAHRFREDLMTAGLGLGWCAFRVRLGVPLEEIQASPVRLLERGEGTALFDLERIPTIEDEEPRVETMEALAFTDPTVIHGIWQLRQCDGLFNEFIRQHGLETFLSVAYAYVLGRPADESGLALYSRLIREAALTPVGVLAALEDSDEFRSRSRQLAAPNSPTFPFQ